MPEPSEDTLRQIVREETAGLKTDTSKLQAHVADLQVSMAEIKEDTKATKHNVDLLLTKVDGFLWSITREEEERTSGDRALERRIEPLEAATLPGPSGQG